MSFVLYEKTDKVARIKLNRPDVHNAFNDEVIHGLIDCVKQAQSDDSRVIVLCSEGKSFSAGGDLGWMRRAAQYSREENLRDAKVLAQMLSLFDRSHKPVIAQIQGAALGGGVGLVSVADIAISSEAAVFGLTEVRVGLIPAVISPYVVRAIGERRARALFITGERFSARDAERFGLVHQVVPAGDLSAAVDKTIATILEGGPEAQGECKRLIHAVSGKDPEALQDVTAQFLAERRASAEGKEGLTAFLEKRAASWKP
jgi:methylglutaconyl-CoA hydratase